jgi:hypothetical protein
MELHVDRRARVDVGDRKREDVGTLLFEQGGPPALPNGFVVRVAGFVAASDAGPNGARADLHLHGVDRRALRQGKDVDDLDRLVVRVAEALRHGGGHHRARDVDVDVGPIERKLVARPSSLGHVQLAAGARDPWCEEDNEPDGK